MKCGREWVIQESLPSGSSHSGLGIREKKKLGKLHKIIDDDSC